MQLGVVNAIGDINIFEIVHLQFTLSKRYVTINFSSAHLFKASKLNLFYIDSSER